MNAKSDIENGRYDHKAAEKKWKAHWQQIDLYKTGDDPNKPYRYVLDFFPYPSGSGLSVGHCKNYVPTDVYSRIMRMKGFNVLHPMGWDAFGLPAENYAIKHNIHPSESSRLFSNTYRRQMQLVECSYDWSREINSTDPDYYRWTQYFFLMLFKRGLAYRAKGEQWWCPDCQTILANEQVENGRCWRCDAIVTKKALAQWYFKITAYADRLLADLDTINWPEPIKRMQRSWIGRSEGAEIRFETQAGVGEIAVFTTRPDTLFGVSFMVLSPEHLLAEAVTTAERETAVSNYIAASKSMNDIERTATDRPKTGVFTGGYAVHPITQQPVPIWVGDYVLAHVGTGAVMGVPAHDERDFAFARQYELPIVPVIEADEAAKPNPIVTSYGTLINSGSYDGLPSAEAQAQIVADLEATGRGKPQVSYKMRDWLISRQRYWGAPIPIIHCPSCGAVPVPEDELPVRLPDSDDFAPAGDGRSPLARIAEWVNVPCPNCGAAAQRETDTMDGFACSSWYFLRFANPHYADGPFDPAEVAKWLPVDTYVGGAEHAVMHLLYARFWTKVMFDEGIIDFAEPFTELRNQGMMLSEEDGRKMSKSRGNVVTPEAVVEAHGVDALRAYVMFLGPFEGEAVWVSKGIRGVERFLEKYWRLASETAELSAQSADPSATRNFQRILHKAIARISNDMERFRYNTAIAALMEFFNEAIAMRDQAIDAAEWQAGMETMTVLLAPIAPFIAEEVWQTVLGHDDSVHLQPWPEANAALATDEQVTIIVQVNGKLRDRIQMVANAKETTVREAAVSSPKVQKYVNGRLPLKVIVVPNKLVNIVV